MKSISRCSFRSGHLPTVGSGFSACFVPLWLHVRSPVLKSLPWWELSLFLVFTCCCYKHWGLRIPVRAFSWHMPAWRQAWGLSGSPGKEIPRPALQTEVTTVYLLCGSRLPCLGVFLCFFGLKWKIYVYLNGVIQYFLFSAWALSTVCLQDASGSGFISIGLCFIGRTDGQMDRLTHAILLFAAADCMAFTWSSSVCYCCHSLCVAGDLGRIDCDSALGCLLCLSHMYSPVFCAVFSFTVGAESGLLCYWRCGSLSYGWPATCGLWGSSLHSVPGWRVGKPFCLSFSLLVILTAIFWQSCGLPFSF